MPLHPAPSSPPSTIWSLWPLIMVWPGWSSWILCILRDAAIPKNLAIFGSPFYFTCSVEVNSTCAKFFLWKTLVTPQFPKILRFSGALFISPARRKWIPPAPRFSFGKLLWRRTRGEKNTVLCTVFFSLSKIWFFFVHSTEASQSSVLLRTEENPNRKNWRRVRQFFLLSDW